MLTLVGSADLPIAFLSSIGFVFIDPSFSTESKLRA